MLYLEYLVIKGERLIIEVVNTNNTNMDSGKPPKVDLSSSEHKADEFMESQPPWYVAKSDMDNYYTDNLCLNGCLRTVAYHMLRLMSRNYRQWLNISQWEGHTQLLWFRNFTS